MHGKVRSEWQGLLSAIKFVKNKSRAFPVVKCEDLTAENPFELRTSAGCNRRPLDKTNQQNSPELDRISCLEVHEQISLNQIGYSADW